MHRFPPYRIYVAVAVIVVVIVSVTAILIQHVRTPAHSLITEVTELVTEAVTQTEEPAGRFEYIEVTNGCAHDYTGTCVNMRSAPNTTAPVVERLRTGVVLKVASTVTVEGKKWYKIAMDPHIAFPERVTSDWYVYADAVDLFTDDGDELLTTESATTTKVIYVNLTEEMLYAYDGDVLFMSEPISTGLEYTPTPPGTFRVFKKTPSRYMQGPLPGVSSQTYDLPGVPWDLYFTNEGAVIHGAYWHDKFGQKWSHGCVNLSPQNAKKLYLWAAIGTPVIVQ